MADKEKGRTVSVSGSINAKSNATGSLTTIRSMPESLAAEAAVLGSMLVDPQCIGEVVEILERDAFYRIEHRYIFDALITLYEKNKGVGIDAVLLRDELVKRNQLEDIGGVEYIAKILDSVPSSANVTYYASVVKDKMLPVTLLGASISIPVTLMCKSTIYPVVVSIVIVWLSSGIISCP